jgi:beta-mannosidase
VVLTTGQVPVKIAPQAVILVGKLDFSSYVSDENRRQLVFTAELWQGAQLISRQTAAFVPFKHLSLTNPDLTVNMHTEKAQLIIELTSHSLALLVEVSLPGAEVVFSDNYFNLPAGRTIQISCPLPAGWTLDRAEKEFRIRSIYDSHNAKE